MNHSNKIEQSMAESEEGRPLIKENIHQSSTRPTQSGARVSQGLADVRKAARKHKETKFTTLLHHVTVDLLRESFRSLKRKAAPGVAQDTGSEAETKSTVGDQITNLASQAKDKVSDLGRAAADKIDDNRDTAASGLETAASTLHESAEALPGGEKVARLAHSAADKLSGTAGYVREHDVTDMMADVEQLVKANPGPSLLAAAAIRFLVSRSFLSGD
jgi:hypothetical protein